MTRDAFDYGDVQALLRFGFKSLTEASYALARVRSPEAARAWLRSAPITVATALSPPPSRAMQVALTAAGMEALGVPRSEIGGFSDEFRGGIAEPGRSRRLGDVGSNDPRHWAWGSGADVPHVLVMLFAKPGRLDAFVADATGGAWNDAFGDVHWLGTGTLRPFEAFGFADGISQPDIDWTRQREPDAERTRYANTVALGEFLLGYPNEYGRYTDRPLLDKVAATADLPAAEDAPEKKDLGRNGTYLVMRQLRQDVRGFWRFVHGRASGDTAEAEKLAAALVGRTRAGYPLMPVTEEPIPGIGSRPGEVRLNQFTYDADPAGVHCPIGAHVRRANPRNADYPGRPSGLDRVLADLGFGRKGFQDDLTSSVRFHRILRRGREYGTPLPPEVAIEPAPPDDPERGLHFVCLNANITRQFEFIQNAWMTSAGFAGLEGENDPLVGNREAMAGCPAADRFTRPREGGVPRRLSGMPQFVTVRGGAYFFLPGRRALRYLAGARG